MINDILVMKWLHILSSTMLFGTGIGTAFYLFFVSRTRDTHAIAIVSKLVVTADWLFTATTIVFQPLSGFWLVHRMGYALASRWIWWATGLFILATLCWLPVVWLQIQLRNMAASAVKQNTDLPPAFWRFAKYWELLGYPAFAAMLVIYYLMVFKPA